MRVDFYITEDAAPAARLRLACRLAEKAYTAGHRVFVSGTDDAELAQLDELLWTFADGSFIPHTLAQDEQAAQTADEPVVLGRRAPGDAPLEIVLNLSSEIPDCASRAQRVIEVIDGDAARRAAGRVRFKAYREMGCELSTHELQKS